MPDKQLLCALRCFHPDALDIATQHNLASSVLSARVPMLLEYDQHVIEVFQKYVKTAGYAGESPFAHSNSPTDDRIEASKDEEAIVDKYVEWYEKVQGQLNSGLSVPERKVRMAARGPGMEFVVKNMDAFDVSHDI